MEKSIFSFIWRYSRLQQLRICLLTLVSFPVLYMTLELPKQIINDAISQPESIHRVLSFELSPVQYLLLLSCSLLLLVIINGIFKMHVNTYKGSVGERLVRRLRYMLIERTLRFPLHQFSHISQGEIIATVVSETEPLADFSTDSIALPLQMGGTLITILLFMFMQNWALGLASIALMPLQMYLIPKIQKKLNGLKQQRILRVRALSQRLGESVSGIEEIRIHGTQRYTMAEYSYRLGQLYLIRLQIFKTKFLMKFLNNTISQITPFLFYSLGGYLVISGEMTLGALVAALAAYKDILTPWKELLNYYQRYHDAVVRYTQIVQQFQPAGLLSFPTLDKDIDLAVGPAKTFQIKNLSNSNENGDRVFTAISLTINPGEVIGIIAPISTVRNSFARIIAMLEKSSSGNLLIGDKKTSHYSEPDLRRRIAYIGPDVFMFNAAISYNFSYGLNHTPPDSELLSPSDKEILRESIAAGNSPDWFDESFESIWTNFPMLGSENWKEALNTTTRVIKVVGAEDQVYSGSLQEKFNPYQLGSVNFDDLPDELLAARERTCNLIKENNLEHLVSRFDENTFNPLATMAENLLFGTIGSDSLDIEALAKLPQLEQCLAEQNIFTEVVSYTQLCLDFILRVYEELPVSDPLVTRLNLDDEERIKELKHLQAHLNQPYLSDLSAEHKIQTLAFFLNMLASDLKQIPISEACQNGIVSARKYFANSLPQEMQYQYYRFYDNKYNPGLSVIDNLLFGRIDTSSAHSLTLQDLVSKAIDEHKLRPILMILFLLHSQAGIGGSRIPDQGKHRINLARMLLKRPDTLILHDALAVLNKNEQSQVINNIHNYRPEMSIIWIAAERPDHLSMNAIYHLDNRGIEKCTGEIGERKLKFNLSNKNNPEMSLINRLEFFASLNQSQAELLAMRSQIIKVTKGTVIYQQGGKATQAHVLINGQASVYDEEDGKRIKFVQLRQYQIAGELEILAHADHPRTLIADTDCEFLCINAEAIQNLIEHNHQLAINFLKNVANKITHNSRDKTVETTDQT